MFAVRSALRSAPAALLLVGCGGADLVLPGDGDPAAIEIVQGDGQSGRVGVALPAAVVGRVSDSQGRPVSGASVAFVFTGDADGATVAPDTATTDADGRAVFQVVLGPHVGSPEAELRVTTSGGKRTLTAPLRFDALSSDANQLSAAGGDGQSAPAGAMLSEPLVVRVTDAFGNPISGVEIRWTADAGSVSANTSSTGEDGLASVDRTLGSAAGPQHTTASAPGLAGSPVTFTQFASAGSATVLELVSGNGQSAPAGTSVPDPLVVQARDGAGNPVAGLAVAWLVRSGGGTVTPGTSSTDDGGRAATSWTLGASPGMNMVTAVVSGVGSVDFSATAESRASPSLSIVTQPPTGAQRGVRLDRSPVVQLRDADGNARQQQGVLVSVALGGGLGTLKGSLIQSTSADGHAEFRDLVIEGPAGAYNLAFTAPGYTGVSSRSIQLSRAPTTITILSDDPDPAPAGIPVRVRYRLESPGGNPDGIVRVRADDGTGCEASAGAAECTLSPTATGQQTITATYQGTSEFDGSSDTEQHTVGPAPPPGGTGSLAFEKQPSATATSDKPFKRQPEIQLLDSGGKPLERSGVSVSATLASGLGSLIGSVSRTTTDHGRAKFEGLGISGPPGTYTIRFSADGFSPVTSQQIELR